MPSTALLSARVPEMPSHRRTGVDNWIEQQLHPDKIDNSALQPRLAMYRTLQMSPREIVLDFPPNPVAESRHGGQRSSSRTTPIATPSTWPESTRSRNKQDEKQTAAPPSARRRRRQCCRRRSSRIQTRSKPSAAKRTSADRLADPASARRAHAAHSQPSGRRTVRPDEGRPRPAQQALLAGLSPQQRETVIALGNPQGVVNTKLQSGKLCAPSTATANSKRSSPISGSTTSTSSSTRAPTAIWSRPMSAT